MNNSNDSELLVRLDERTRATAEDVAEIKEAMAANYVTKAEFAPVRSLVFGAVALILTAFIAALIYVTGLSK